MYREQKKSNLSSHACYWSDNPNILSAKSFLKKNATSKTNNLESIIVKKIY